MVYFSPHALFSQARSHMKMHLHKLTLLLQETLTCPTSYGTVTVNYSLLDLASDYHLEQLMHENTKRNHILDLVFCTNPSYVSNVNVVPGISDHEAVSFCFNSIPLTYEKSTHKIYLYNQGNFDAIKECLQYFQTSFLSSDPFINSVQENLSE